MTTHTPIPALTRETIMRRTAIPMALAAAALAVGGITTAQSPSLSPPPSEAPVGSPTAIDLDGITWRFSDDGTRFDRNALAFDLAVGTDGTLLLVGVLTDQFGQSERAAVWRSTNGRKWTALKSRTPKGTEATGVIADGSGFLVSAVHGRRGGLVWRSDGRELSTVAELTGAPYGIARSSMGIHVAGVEQGVPAVWTSVDEGGTWTPAYLGGNGRVLHVAVSSTGTLVALGAISSQPMIDEPMIWTSSDGVTWTPIALGLEPGSWSLPALEQTPVGMIAVLRYRLADGSSGSTVLLSQDGMTWREILEGSDALSVGSAGTEAVAFGSDRWWHSPDGSAWTEQEESGFRGLRITTSQLTPDARLIAAGNMFLADGSLVGILIGRVPSE